MAPPLLSALGLGILFGGIHHLIQTWSHGVKNQNLKSSSKNLSDEDMQHLLALLYMTCDNESKQAAYVHQGVTCNSCGISPISGIRYRCAHCVDYDLCNDCAAKGHDPAHILIKITLPIPIKRNPQWILPEWLPRASSLLKAPENLPVDQAMSLAVEFNLDLDLVDEVYTRFALYTDTVLVTEQGVKEYFISRSTFVELLCPRKDIRSSRLMVSWFDTMDMDHDGLIGLKDFMNWASYFEGHSTLLTNAFFMFCSYADVSRFMILDLLGSYSTYQRTILLRGKPSGLTPLYLPSFVRSARPFVSSFTNLINKKNRAVPYPNMTRIRDARKRETFYRKLSDGSSFDELDYGAEDDDFLHLPHDRFQLSGVADSEVADYVLKHVATVADFYGSYCSMFDVDTYHSLEMFQNLSLFVKHLYL